MNATTTPRHAAASLLARRPRWSLAILIAFLAVAGVLGGGLAGKLQAGGFQSTDTESARAVAQIAEASGIQVRDNITVLVRDPSGAAPTQAAIADVAADLDSIGGVARVITPSPQAPGLVSTDGRSALVIGQLDAEADVVTAAEQAVETFDGRAGLAVGGAAVTQNQLQTRVTSDLGRAELFAFPLLALLCLFIFGRRGVLLPLLVAATTVVSTFLVLTVVNELYSLSVFAMNLVMGLGLGLAIDYSLFLLSRYRDELDAGADPTTTLRTTMRMTGRTVAFSAATVAAALGTLTAFPLGFAKSMGIAGAAVAVMAAVSSLVVAPPVLALFGAKLARRARPIGDERQGAWYRLSKGVMRRPGTVALVTTALMVAIAAPAMRTVWTPVDGTAIPSGLSSRTVFDAITEDFPGGDASTVTVALRGDESGANAYAEQVSTLPGVAATGTPMTPRPVGESMWQLDVPVDGAPASETAQQLVRDLRDVSSPADALVGGPAAEFVDQQAELASGMPLALGLLVVLTGLVLWLMTGSVVLPVKAVIMNVLTVGGALSAITLIYQDGRLTDLLGYTSNGGVEPTDFIVSAAVVFALSTDYGVFLLGRIKELRDGGLSDREAVAVGVQRTGHVVTAAALLLAVAVGAFSTSSVPFIQQIGIAVAFGVLIDAFVVRSLLVPSLMGLLGRWNWWSPGWLRRVHDKIGLSETGTGPLQNYSHGTMTEAPTRPNVTV